MITSMTGYGHGTCTAESLEISVEVRSVNNRFLDVSFKLPKRLATFEQQVREIVGKYASRGRINIWMAIKDGNDNSSNFVVNSALVEAYVSVAKQLSEQHGIKGTLSLGQVITLPDIIVANLDEDADKKTWQCAKRALEEALTQMKEMREREGVEIKNDLVARINSLELLSAEIEELATKGPEIELSRLKERVQRYLDKKNIDEYRLELELALISDRIDISEECTRFKSHITLFREMLDDKVSQGRKLNFLLQEMNREANTMASKSYTAEISHIVVKIKEEIEKVREQVQNIE